MSLPKLDTVEDQQKKRFERSKPEMLSMIEKLEQMEFDLHTFSDYLNEDELLIAKSKVIDACSLIKLAVSKGGVKKMSEYAKAKKFINKHGVEFTLNWLSKNIAHTPTHGKYVDIDSELNPKGIISTNYYGGFHVEHLVKLTGYDLLLNEYFR